MSIKEQFLKLGLVNKKDLPVEEAKVVALIRPENSTEFLREEEESCRVYRYTGNADREKVLKKMRHGDLAILSGGIRLSHSYVCLQDPLSREKKLLFVDHEEVGYAEIPLEVSRWIENPIYFYQTNSLGESCFYIAIDTLVVAHKELLEDFCGEATLRWQIEDSTVYYSGLDKVFAAKMADF